MGLMVETYDVTRNSGLFNFIFVVIFNIVIDDYDDDENDYLKVIIIIIVCTDKEHVTINNI